MKTRERVRYIKKMLHQRQIERGSHLIDVPINQLAPEAQEELLGYAKYLVENAQQFAKPVRKTRKGYVVQCWPYTWL